MTPGDAGISEKILLTLPIDGCLEICEIANHH